MTHAHPWRPRAVPSPLALVAWALLGCLRARPDVVLVTVTSPVPMEFIRHDVISVVHGGGRGSLDGLPTRRTIGVIRVHAQPLHEVYANCFEPSPELVSDATGARIAYRCNPGDPWDLVYLPTPTHAPVACARTVGSGPRVDWAPVPAFDAAAAALAGCNIDVVDLVRARGQEAAVAALLAETIDRTLLDREPRGDGWLRQYAALPAAHQGRLLGLLRALFLAPHPGALALYRAVQLLDLEDPSLLDATIERARELAAPSAASRPMNRLTRGVLLHRLSRARPALAGALGCEVLSSTREPADAFALIAVAHSRTACPAVSRLLAERVCGTHLDCGAAGAERHLCTLDELTADFEAVLARPAAEAASFQPAEDWYRRATFGAALALGVVPARMLRLNARRHYAIDQPTGPECGNGPRGQPCRCFRESESLADAVCATPEMQVDGHAPLCDFRFDDEAHRITGVVGRLGR